MKHALMKRSFSFHALNDPYVKEKKVVKVVSIVYMILLIITHILMGAVDALDVYIQNKKWTEEEGEKKDNLKQNHYEILIAWLAFDIATQVSLLYFQWKYAIEIH